MFDSGMFSDVTIYFGETHLTHNHEYKVHSTVLLSKCEWFAAKWKIMIDKGKSPRSWKPTGRSMIVPGLSAELIEAIGDTRFVECECHKVTTWEGCHFWIGFLSMIKFCYTQNYLGSLHYSDSPPRWKSFLHIYMYMLGQQYGVKDMLTHAINGFKDEIRKLRNNEREEVVIKRINLIFEMYKDDENNMLRVEAFKEARLVVSTLKLRRHTEQGIKKLMPGAGKILFPDKSTAHKLPRLRPKPSIGDIIEEMRERKRQEDSRNRRLSAFLKRRN